MSETQYRRSTSSFRLARSSIGVLMVAIVVTAVSGFFAYRSSRQTFMDLAAQQSLAVAQTLVNELEFDLGDRQRTIEHVSDLWSRTEPTFPGSFLCLVERPGRIALNTASPSKLGMDVSGVIVGAEKSNPTTVLQLLESKGSRATQNINFQGRAQLAGYAYLPSLDALLVVHVPEKSIESKVRKTALPWVLALAAMGTLLIPLSIGLSHFGFRSSKRAARDSWLGQRQTEQRYQAIFDATFQFIGLLSTEGILLEANATALNFGGLTRDDVIGKLFWETFWWRGDEDRVHQLQDAVKRAAGGEFVRYSVDVQGVSKIEIVDFSLKPFRSDDGTVAFLVGEGRIITEQKKAELRLAESESRLRAVIDSEPECVKLLDKNGDLLNMNPAGLAMIEADSLEQVVNHSIFPLIEDSHREAFRTMHRRVMAGETAELEFEIVGLKGNHRWMDTHASPLRDANDQIIGHLAVTRDISDRKLFQQQLQFTQFSVDSCSSPIFWIRADANFFYVNDAATRNFGYSRDEWLKMSVHDIDPAYPKEVWPKFWSDVRRQQTLSFESELCCKDGTRVPVEITTSLLEIEGQEFVFAFVIDKTARKAAEKLLRTIEARFRALVEHSYDVISLLSADGQMIYVSPSIERVLGYGPDAALDLNPISLLHPDDMEDAARVVRQLLEKDNSVIHTIIRLKHKNDSYRTVEVTATNLLNERGVNAIVAIFRDITERRVAEERLREKESQLTHFARVSTLGEMAAGIAHEINQPLHAVANFATASAIALQSAAAGQILQQELVDNLTEWNQGIKAASQRASEIVQRLRRYVRKTDSKYQLVHVTRLLDEAIDLVEFESRRHQVEIDLQVPDDLPDVICDRIQIHQVLVNLLQNALESLKQSGNRQRRIGFRAAAVEGRIQIKVSDNGMGVDREIRGKIFDAFYTTKPHGMGLGLAISRTIVENHGGFLSEERNESDGATFAFSLPLPPQGKVAIEESANAI